MSKQILHSPLNIYKYNVYGWFKASPNPQRYMNPPPLSTIYLDMPFILSDADNVQRNQMCYVIWDCIYIYIVFTPSPYISCPASHPNPSPVYLIYLSIIIYFDEPFILSAMQTLTASKEIKSILKISMGWGKPPPPCRFQNAQTLRKCKFNLTFLIENVTCLFSLNG